jgi:autotransporter-associated beta strand protein
VASGSGEPEDKGAEAQGFFSAVSTFRFQLSGFILPLLMLCISGASAQVTNTNTVTNGGTIGSGTTSLITNPVTNITGAITNNGQLLFGQTNSTVTDPFAISGTGSLTISGLNGTTILSATNAFTNAAKLYLYGGTLVFGASNNFGSGNITVNGGTAGATVVFNGPMSTTGSLNVGNAASDRSLAIVNSNANFNAITLGNAGSGALYLGGGTLTTASAAVTAMDLGNLTTGYGYLSLSGGVLNTYGITMGNVTASTAGGPGVIDVLGGTLNLTNSSGSSISFGTAPGVINVSGGTLNSGQMTLLGNGGSSFVLINVGQGGNLNMGTSVIYISNGGGDNGYQNFTTVNGGGTLTYGGLSIYSQYSDGVHLYVNGGTLKATANTSTLLGNSAFPSTHVDFGPGGAIIDNGGFSVIIGQNLKGTNANGLGSVVITNGGAGYIGAPIVKISGGGGTGATAIAQIDTNSASGTYGQVTNIQITDLGTGYTSAPTITLTGGGAATTASGFSVTLTNFTSGGFTYQGAGTTTITGSNTYTGSTLIQTNSSVLVTTSPSPFGTGSLTDNGQLIFSNNLTFTVGGLAGSGSLTQAGTGTLILGGSNSYTGTTLISAGTLQIGTNGTNGSLPLGAISNNATLRLSIA